MTLKMPKTSSKEVSQSNLTKDNFIRFCDIFETWVNRNPGGAKRLANHLAQAQEVIENPVLVMCAKNGDILDPILLPLSISNFGERIQKAFQRERETLPYKATPVFLISWDASNSPGSRMVGGVRVPDNFTGFYYELFWIRG